MIIVSGWIEVVPGQRDIFLANSHEAMVLARRAHGCNAFVVAADPIEPHRVNVYEEWTSAVELDAFRGDGPDGEMTSAIIDAAVARYDLTSSGPA